MSHYKLTRVLSTDGLDKNGIQKLKDFGLDVVEKKLSKADLIKELVNFDAIIIRSATTIDADIINAVTANENNKLKVIARAGTGVDNINVTIATEKGLLVLNTPAANTISAAEHTFALMCSLSRQIPQAYLTMQQGKWDRKTFMGTELMHKTLAIIGLGKIGKEVALRAQAFGMKTIGFDPLLGRDEALKFGVEWMELKTLWSLADYVTVHVPLIKQTSNLINAEVFSECKRGMKVINCSRGGIVNEDDLLVALESGQCGGAALDVFLEEPPTCVNLIKHPKVISTPHLGASTVEAQFRVSMEIADNIISLSKGEKFSGLVNGHSLEISDLEEVRSWKIFLDKLSPIVKNLSEAKLFYSNDINCCTKQAFENFILNYLAMVTLPLKKTISHSVNLVNANNLAKKNNLHMSIQKLDEKKSNFHQLVLEVQNQNIEFMISNGNLFVIGFNKLNLSQPILLEGPGQLLVTSDAKEASELLSYATEKNVLISYYFQKENQLFILTVKKVGDQKFEHLKLSIEF